MRLPLGLGMAVPMSAAMIAIAPGLGAVAHLYLFALLLACLGTGRLLCAALRLPDEPFLAFVAGFAVISHALVLGDAVVAGAHPAIVMGFLVLGLPGISRSAPRRANALAVLAGLFVLAWCWDIAPRMAHFAATGQLDFWLDLLVHAAGFAQFTSPDAVGRGMILMVDWPRPLYHYASLIPVAPLASLAGTAPLDIAAFAWIPFGMIVMAAGVIALGVSLGGTSLAVAGLLALAWVPNPEQWTLANGFLGFAWLLETSPGTTYSVGVGCAALAGLAHTARQGREGAGGLFLAAMLTASCFLIRANTFVWLAPTVVLGAIAVWHWPGPRQRLGLILLGLAGLVGALMLLSWPTLVSDPRQFLFGYLNWAYAANGPTRVDGLLPALTPWIGRVGAGMVALVLLLPGMLGPWLPLGLALGWLAWRRGLVTRVDALPVLLLFVAITAILLAPVSRNGDITEFRHRAGPLLVTVWAIWSMRFAMLWLADPVARLSLPQRGAIAVAMSAISLCVLAYSVGNAKRPAMAWGSGFYGTAIPPDLVRLSDALPTGNGERLSFAFANQPADSRNIDDASRLTALSGLPAYLSCPGFLLSTGGSVGQEATRRLGVLATLASARDVEALKAIMRRENITHYIASGPGDAAFDPERSSADMRVGDYAIYFSRVLP